MDSETKNKMEDTIENIELEICPPIKEEGVNNFRDRVIRDYHIRVYKHPTKNEDFAIVEDWMDVESIMYHAVEALVGQDMASDLYDDNSVGYGDIENVRSNISEVPDILVDAFNYYFGNTYFEDVIGMDWGFSDEFSACLNCNKAVRTQTYHGPADIVFIEGSGLYCGDCIRNDDQMTEQYIESHLRNNPNHANYIIDDSYEFHDRGYRKVQDIIEDEDGQYDAGWYRWNSQDDPQELYERFKDDYDVVFDMTDYSPFYTKWTVWLREK